MSAQERRWGSVSKLVRLAGLIGLVSATGCPNQTSVLLDIQFSQNASSIGQLRISGSGLNLAAFSQVRPAAADGGVLSSPQSVRILLPDQSQELHLQVEGLSVARAQDGGDGEPVARWEGSVDIIAGREARAAATLWCAMGSTCDLDLGAAHGCAIYQGTPHCWGKNGVLQLARNQPTYSPIPLSVEVPDTPVTQLAAGHSHTCAITAKHKLACWGSNSNGQTGNVGAVSPVFVVPYPQFETGWRSVACGQNQTCALTKSQNQVWCWGGDGGPRPRKIETESGSNLQARVVAGGEGHFCALLLDGGVSCWGSNELGQITGAADSGVFYPMPTPFEGLQGKSVQDLAAGSFHTCALLSSRSVQCWGRGGDVFMAGPVRLVTAGGYYSCALLMNGAVKCWGSNATSQLGQAYQGMGVASATPIEIVGLDGGLVSSLAAGHTFACARMLNGRVWCWGDNSSGQLGFDGGIDAGSSFPSWPIPVEIAFPP